MAPRPTQISRKGLLVEVDEIQRETSGGLISPSLAALSLDTGGRCLWSKVDSFNLSRIQTAIVAVISGNLELADAPGNVLVPAPQIVTER